MNIVLDFTYTFVLLLVPCVYYLVKAIREKSRKENCYKLYKIILNELPVIHLKPYVSVGLFFVCIQIAVDIYRYNLSDDETPTSAESAKPHLPGQGEHECKPAIA